MEEEYIPEEILRKIFGYGKGLRVNNTLNDIYNRLQYDTYKEAYESLYSQEIGKYDKKY